MAKLKNAAIIQARMGAARLPGKVLMEIEGKPMLWHIVERLKHSALIDRIIVATTEDKKDDPIEELCLKNRIDLYRGSEDDVLDRYYRAAKEYSVKNIVRITGDCPLVDYQIADYVISKHSESDAGADCACNVIKRTYPRGLDVIAVSFGALEKTWKEAKEPHHREHVTAYLFEHPEKFKILNVEHAEDLSNLRWTVDEENDLVFVRGVYKRLYSKNKKFLMGDVLKVLEYEPALVDINKDVKQKPEKI